MVLGFKHTFPWGLPTYFIEKILKKPGFVPKPHSIRKGFRWKAGMKIHFATGVRTNKYNQFHESICISTQEISIYWNFDSNHKKSKKPVIFIDSRVLHPKRHIELALNDGFDSVNDFYKWFNDDFLGQIVHWTYFKY